MSRRANEMNGATGRDSNGFAHAVIQRNDLGGVCPRQRALGRSMITLGLFLAAMAVALFVPLVAFAMVTCVLIAYARPDIPASHAAYDS